MVFIYINKTLFTFEADIRDICMAFFSMKKLIYLYEDNFGAYFDKDGKNINTILSECNINNRNIIIVKDYYDKYVEITNENKKLIKIDLKKRLYDKLSKLTNKKLLWGTLTGIRPTTIVTNFIENEYPKNDNKYAEIKQRLKDDYYLSDEKTNELIDIAIKEIDILNRDEIKDYKNKYSVYIGIPFCRSTCLYCSFTSFNIDKYQNYVEKFLDKLEYELTKNIYISPMTIYIGGGTPTSLSEKDFYRLLSIIDKNIKRDNLIEWTVEAGRPDTITINKLKMMKDLGVNRISINPQTFNQKTLDIIGRKHTIEDVIEKYYMARDLGFSNINMDIILGLPDEHLKEVKNTLFYIKKLKPDSLTVHSLALKRAARLNKEKDNILYKYYLAGLNNDNSFGFFNNTILKHYFHSEIEKMFNESKKCAKNIDLNPYYLYRQKNISGNLENVGYAKNQKECIYNIMMMSERHTVYGFGTGSSKIITYNGNEKIVKGIEGYKSVIDYCK